MAVQCLHDPHSNDCKPNSFTSQLFLLLQRSAALCIDLKKSHERDKKFLHICISVPLLCLDSPALLYIFLMFSLRQVLALPQHTCPERHHHHCFAFAHSYSLSQPFILLWLKNVHVHMHAYTGVCMKENSRAGSTIIFPDHPTDLSHGVRFYLYHLRTICMCVCLFVRMGHPTESVPCCETSPSSPTYPTCALRVSATVHKNYIISHTKTYMYMHLSKSPYIHVHTFSYIRAHTHRHKYTKTRRHKQTYTPHTHTNTVPIKMWAY